MQDDGGREAPMSTQPRPRMSPAEYLAAERRAGTRHEYFAGEVFEVEGASRKHGLIVTNLIYALRGRLRSEGCEVYPSSMRVKVSQTGAYVYPDVVVVCEEPELEDEHFDTLLNPALVIEVLSPSTEDHDRGRKAWHYRRVDSIQEYVIVSQDQPLVERHRRQGDGEWLVSELRGADASLQLGSVGCTLALTEIYDGVPD